jgi:hypothetical protein
LDINGAISVITTDDGDMCTKQADVLTKVLVACGGDRSDSDSAGDVEVVCGSLFGVDGILVSVDYDADVCAVAAAAITIAADEHAGPVFAAAVAAGTEDHRILATCLFGAITVPTASCNESVAAIVAFTQDYVAPDGGFRGCDVTTATSTGTTTPTTYTTPTTTATSTGTTTPSTSTTTTTTSITSTTTSITTKTKTTTTTTTDYCRPNPCLNGGVCAPVTTTTVTTTTTSIATTAAASTTEDVVATTEGEDQCDGCDGCPCDDGDAATWDDTCIDGKCAGVDQSDDDDDNMRARRSDDDTDEETTSSGSSGEVADDGGGYEGSSLGSGSTSEELMSGYAESGYEEEISISTTTPTTSTSPTTTPTSTEEFAWLMPFVGCTVLCFDDPVYARGCYWDPHLSLDLKAAHV